MKSEIDYPKLVAQIESYPGRRKAVAKALGLKYGTFNSRLYQESIDEQMYEQLSKILTKAKTSKKS